MHFQIIPKYPGMIIDRFFRRIQQCDHRMRFDKNQEISHTAADVQEMAQDFKVNGTV